MPRETINSVYWQGMRDAAPFALVIVPFSMLFGVVATEAGMNVFETMAFSILVIAGAAQFTAVQLLSENAPVVIALLTSLAVNLRMAMYSASLTPHIGKATLTQRALVAYFTVDQSYACAMLAYENNPDWSLRHKLIYYAGTVVAICPLWYVFTLVGALVGSAIPASFALDFAVPITFLAMIAPMLRTPAHVAAALVSIVTSLIFAFMPYSLGLLVAGVAGMIAGARTEVMLERRGVAV